MMIVIPMRYICGLWLLGALLLAAVSGCTPTVARIDDMRVTTQGRSAHVSVLIDPDAGADDVEMFVAIEAERGRPVFAQPVATVTLDKAPQWIELDLTSVPVDLWTPDRPMIYLLDVSAINQGRTLATGTARMTFVNFQWQQGIFHLNGQPVRLAAVELDVSQFPAFDGDEDRERRFAEACIKDLKQRHVNAVRLVNGTPLWRIVCMEQGMIPLDRTDAREVVIDPVAAGQTVLDYVGRPHLGEGEEGILLRPVLRLRQQASQMMQKSITRLAIEHARRNHLGNKRIAGIMPIGRLYDVPDDARRFEDCQPTAMLEQLGESYQPMLVSWDHWTPNIYSGEQSPAMANLVNQAHDGQDLENAVMVCELINAKGQVISGGTISVSRALHGYSGRAPVVIDVPADSPDGLYRIRSTLRKGEAILSTGELPVHVRSRNWARLPAVGKRVTVIDPSGKTQAAMQRLGVEVEPIAKLDKGYPLVVNCEQWQAEQKQWDMIRNYAKRGGRVVLLRPGQSHLESLGADMKVAPVREGTLIRPSRSGHPIFHGIEADQLIYWSDPQPGDLGTRGRPHVLPVTAGVSLERSATGGHVDVLALYGPDDEAVALVEWYVDNGTILISGFELVPRAQRDPIADRMLANIVAYVCSPHKKPALPKLDRAIEWGNARTEASIISGTVNGLAPAEGGRYVVGDFRLDSLGRVIETYPDQYRGTGHIAVEIPQGSRNLITRVANPSDEALAIVIQVNQQAAQTFTIQPGRSSEVSVIVQPGAARIEFTADKRLVLKKTWAQ